MGFYGMTWSIMPLGGGWAGSIADYLGAPFAVTIGGLAVIVFAVGPALLNGRVRNIGATVAGCRNCRPRRAASCRCSPTRRRRGLDKHLADALNYHYATKTTLATANRNIANWNGREIC